MFVWQKNIFPIGRFFFRIYLKINNNFCISGRVIYDYDDISLCTKHEKSLKKALRLKNR